MPIQQFKIAAAARAMMATLMITLPKVGQSNPKHSQSSGRNLLKV